MATLPAFKIWTDIPRLNYVTSMAAGTTVEDAKKYFLGRHFWLTEKEIEVIVLDVTPA